MLVLCHPQRDNRSYARLSRPGIAAWAVHDDCDAFAIDNRCDLPQPMTCAERPALAGSSTGATLGGQRERQPFARADGAIGQGLRLERTALLLKPVSISPRASGRVGTRLGAS